MGEEDKNIQTNVDMISTNEQNVQENEKTLKDILQDPKIKAEYDRNVENILNKRHDEWKKQKEAEEAEAKRLEKLSAQERLDEREKAIQKREAEINRKELISATKDILIQENLPISFAENLVSSTSQAEDIRKAIGELKEIFNTEVEKRVATRFKGDTPVSKISNKIYSKNLYSNSSKDNEI